MRSRISNSRQAEDGSANQAQFVLYFSGRGVEIGDFTYLFGKGARPDLNAAAQIVMQSGAPGDPFPDTAFDLYREFYLRFGDLSIPVVVIFDACRENPIPQVIAEKIVAKQRLPPKMGVPSTRSVSSVGMHRIFSTTRGKPAYDVLGLNGVTALLGLEKVGRPVAGDTVVVSTAAGSVGLAVGQIAKLLGCHVVGITGGIEKSRHLSRGVRL